MNRALWAAKTGLDAQQTRMTVVSNNLANVNTTGFKRDRAIFEDLLYQTLRAGGRTSSQDTQLPTGLQPGHGHARGRDREALRAGQPGAHRQLARSRDRRPRLFPGPAARRHDRLHAGWLVQARLAGQHRERERVIRCSRRLSIPTDTVAITIGADGTASVSQQGQLPAADRSARCRSWTSSTPAGLQARGGNLLLESAAERRAAGGQPRPQRPGQLNQGTLEASNVNVVEELVNMIEVQRAYEMNSKAVSTTDQMLRYLTDQPVDARHEDRTRSVARPLAAGCAAAPEEPDGPAATRHVRAGSGREHRRDLPERARRRLLRGSQGAPRGRHHHHPAAGSDPGEQELEHQDQEGVRHAAAGTDDRGTSVTVNGVPVLDMSVTGDREFNGEGSSSQSNRLQGSITATVVERLPNGNLVIEGEKWLTLNQGDELVHVAGHRAPVRHRAGQHDRLGQDRERAHPLQRARAHSRMRTARDGWRGSSTRRFGRTDHGARSRNVDCGERSSHGEGFRERRESVPGGSGRAVHGAHGREVPPRGSNARLIETLEMPMIDSKGKSFAESCCVRGRWPGRRVRYFGRARGTHQGSRACRGRSHQPAGGLRPGRRPRRHGRPDEPDAVHRAEPEEPARAVGRGDSARKSTRSSRTSRPLRSTRPCRRSPSRVRRSTSPCLPSATPRACAAARCWSPR